MHSKNPGDKHASGPSKRCNRDEDEELNEIAPAKRQEMSHKTSKQPYLSDSNETPSRRQTSTPSHTFNSSPVPPPAPVHGQPGRIQGAWMDLPPPPFNPLSNLSHEYGARICAILHIESGWARRYNLSQLRTYARAYNNQLTWVLWWDRKMPDEATFCRGHYIFWPNTHLVTHIAHGIDAGVFRPLATARGDLLDDGTEIQDGNQNYTASSIEDQEALGLIDNPLGLHSQLQDAVDIRFG